VTLDGKEWEVYGITVGDYLDGNFNEKVARSQNNIRQKQNPD
jgi:hypothetical protein